MKIGDKFEINDVAMLVSLVIIGASIVSSLYVIGYFFGH